MVLMRPGASHRGLFAHSSKASPVSKQWIYPHVMLCFLFPAQASPSGSSVIIVFTSYSMGSCDLALFTSGSCERDSQRASRGFLHEAPMPQWAPLG